MIDTYAPLAYAGAIVFVSAAALAASYVPSRRAARIDPLPRGATTKPAPSTICGDFF